MCPVMKQGRGPSFNDFSVNAQDKNADRKSMNHTRGLTPPLASVFVTQLFVNRTHNSTASPSVMAKA